MNLGSILIWEEFCDTLKDKLCDFNIDTIECLETKSFKMLKDIHNVLTDSTLSDFEIVEEIVCIFEKHSIGCGGCHDF